jgi:hypothetical protein
MSITAMKQALEALEWAEYLVETSEQSSQEARRAFDAAMPALRTAIAQAEAEIKPLYFVQHPDGSHSVADPQPTAIAEAEKQEPFDQDYEREQFEKWYCVAAFDFERDPIGSKLCGDQWAAWKERAKRAAPVQAQEQRKPGRTFQEGAG